MQIIGPDGPCGKTALQALIKELLEERGFKVSCTEATPFRVIHSDKWEQALGRFHKGAAKRKLNPMRVAIEVISV